jgi:hypothetical protein
MFVLAHLSDLHMALRPRLIELAGKRGLGFINWQRGRRYIHRPETLAAITPPSPAIWSICRCRSSTPRHGRGSTSSVHRMTSA